MPDHTASESGRRRSDALRNRQELLDAASVVFAERGVGAPVRDVAAAAGVGMGTVYRHFPSRADLIVAVYQHQVDRCAEAGPQLLATAASPFAALVDWIEMFVDFLVTKHGLPAALHSDQDGADALHAYFVDRLVPVAAELLGAARAAGEVHADVSAYELLRAVGNLCLGTDPDYEPRRMIAVLLRGLQVRA